MLRPEDKWLAQLLLFCLAATVVIILTGCVTIRECHTGVDNAVYIRCSIQHCCHLFDNPAYVGCDCHVEMD